MKSCRKSGQALIEYLILFSFMSIIGVGMVKGLSSIMENSVNRFGYILSKHLSVGVCPQDCLYGGYLNSIPDGE